MPENSYLWLKEAACRGMDPNDFHSNKPEARRKTRMVCVQCSVWRDCLIDRLETYSSFEDDATGCLVAGELPAERRGLRNHYQATGDLPDDYVSYAEVWTWQWTASPRRKYKQEMTKARNLGLVV